MKKNRKLQISRETLHNLVDSKNGILNNVQGGGDRTGRICLIDTCRCTPYCPWTGGCE